MKLAVRLRKLTWNINRRDIGPIFSKYLLSSPLPSRPLTSPLLLSVLRWWHTPARTDDGSKGGRGVASDQRGARPCARPAGAPLPPSQIWLEGGRGAGVRRRGADGGGADGSVAWPCHRLAVAPHLPPAQILAGRGRLAAGGPWQTMAGRGHVLARRRHPSLPPSQI